MSTIQGNFTPSHLCQQLSNFLTKSKNLLQLETIQNFMTTRSSLFWSMVIEGKEFKRQLYVNYPEVHEENSMRKSQFANGCINERA